MKRPSVSPGNPRLIVPSDQIPIEEVELTLDPDEQRILETTFLRLCALVHSRNLSARQKENILLLLSTCRNEWFTTSAMYAEARKWASESEKINFQGYGDALDALRSGLSGQTTLDRAAALAAKRLESSAGYLDELVHKHEFYFNEFDKTYQELLAYIDSLPDRISARDFRRLLQGLPAGDVRLALRGPQEATDLPHIQRLCGWHDVVKPLDSLTRTYISNVLCVGRRHSTSCSDYMSRLAIHANVWKARGFHVPESPPNEVFVPRQLVDSGEVVSGQQVKIFLAFCDEMLRSARYYLDELLPESGERETGFPLRFPVDSQKVTIADKSFELHPAMFVLITDMRNSVGARYEAPELKVEAEDIIDRLRRDQHASSQTLYDDCRVVACQSINDLFCCVQRLHGAFEVRRKLGKFDGLRMGASCGEMLLSFAEPGCWSDHARRTGAPLDTADTTIARSARLMGFDKLRWETTSLAELLRGKLQATYADDASLLFMDSSVYASLPPAVRDKCLCLDLMPLKGMGLQMCWSIAIRDFVLT